MGTRDADLSSQAGNDHAEDQGCHPGEHRARLDGGETLRDIGADCLEVAQARERPRPEPYAAQASNDIEPCARGCGCCPSNDPAFAVG